MKPKGKRNQSDKIMRRPRVDRDVKKNPFELFLTKAKHVIAGRNSNGVAAAAGIIEKLNSRKQTGKQKQRVQIQTQGLRSVSRNASLQHRKKTLLHEYKTRTMNNKLLDRRLGEKDATMSLDDKMMERVVFERKQCAKAKRKRFNLNDVDEVDDDLSFGQTLADVERLEAAEDDAPLEEAEEGLGEKFVSEHHFGGGLLKKVEIPRSDGDPEASRSNYKLERKLLVDDIIAESKQKKYAKQSELDEVRDMTKALDEKWGDVQMRSLIASSFSHAVPDPPVEPYDSMVKMLLFDSKAKASNKLKSDSELAKEAKEELEKAEKERRKSLIKSTAKNADRKAVVSNSRGIELLEPEMEDFVTDDDEAECADEVGGIGTDICAELAPDSEIPFVIQVPKKRSELTALFNDRSPDEMLTIVNRIMKFHHISLAEVNREKLTAFFKLLLDYMLNLCENSSSSSTVSCWIHLTPALHELFQIAAENGEQLLKTRLEALSALVCRRSKYELVPSAVFFMKFLTVCFPPDNSNHPFTAALILLMGKVLVKSHLADRRSFLTSMFVATMANEFAEASKRYIPELVNHFKRVILLELRDKVYSPTVEMPSLKFSVHDLFDAQEGAAVTRSDELKALELTVVLLENAAKTYSGLPAYSEIFSEFVSYFRELNNRDFYQTELKSRFAAFEQLVDSHRQSRSYVAFFKKKPAPLQLLEPRIDSKFDRSKSAKKTAIKRLVHDRKRAVKGAKRELRRDNQFIARVQLDEQSTKDAVRQKKVKEIFSNLYTQQSEGNALKRQKARLKI